MDPFDIPGLNFMGYIRSEDINGGVLIPLFSPVQIDGRESINTLEGWNNAAQKQNRGSFCSAMGRDPDDNNELTAWVYAQV